MSSQQDLLKGYAVAEKHLSILLRMKSFACKPKFMTLEANVWSSGGAQFRPFSLCLLKQVYGLLPMSKRECEGAWAFACSGVEWCPSTDRIFGNCNVCKCIHPLYMTRMFSDIYQWAPAHVFTATRIMWAGSPFTSGKFITIWWIRLFSSQSPEFALIAFAQLSLREIEAFVLFCWLSKHIYKYIIGVYIYIYIRCLFICFMLWLRVMPRQRFNMLRNGWGQLIMVSDAYWSHNANLGLWTMILICLSTNDSNDYVLLLVRLIVICMSPFVCTDAYLDMHPQSVTGN